jgi:hypothetical protein
MEYDGLITDEEADMQGDDTEGLISRLNYAVIGIYRSKLQERYTIRR